MNATVTLEVPAEAIRLFGASPDRFGREMYETAVVKWYDEGRISSGKGAEFLGVTRAAFLELLSGRNVSPFQYTPKELVTELVGDRSSGSRQRTVNF